MKYWLIYDDSEYEGQDTLIECPAFGLQIVVYEDPRPSAYNVGYLFLKGGDFYVWHQDEWLSMDWAGLYDWLLRYHPDLAKNRLAYIDLEAVANLGTVKFGRALPRAQFDTLWRETTKRFQASAKDSYTRDFNGSPVTH